MAEKRLLLTGFEPFGDWKINPSFEAVKAFEDATFGDEIRVIVEEIPVKFRQIGPRIKELISNLTPKMILHVGQSNRASISVERVALNVANVLKRSYNCGAKPTDEELVPDAPAAYFATIPARKLVEHLISRKIPAEVSYHAGT
ncbi:MAG: pyroglutamyl-peptidase I, partial [Candidatus Hodarchaeota archaeon]